MYIYMYPVSHNVRCKLLYMKLLFKHRTVTILTVKLLEILMS
jgi:hypothetical protein